MFYSHDTYGLGHLRRTTLLATGVVNADPTNEALIITGSPQAQAFHLPPRVETIKLPTATKNSSGGYEPRKMLCGMESLVHLRTDLIQAAVRRYQPDVFVVDHAPQGMAGELLPVLDYASQAPEGPRLVLGLRDIIDDADKIGTRWTQDRVWDTLGLYDQILVYGDRSVLTTAQELAVRDRTGSPPIHTGYVTPAMPEPSSAEPFLLVTPGGGGDGQNMLRRFIDAVEVGATGDLQSIVVTGPLLSSARRTELLLRADRLPSITVVEFTEHMRSLVSSAAGVISMAGYNTVAEELAAGSQALLVPRTRPRMEQAIRATRLDPLSSLEHCPLGSLTPRRLRHFVANLQDARHPNALIDLRGVETAANAITGHLDVTARDQENCHV